MPTNIIPVDLNTPQREAVETTEGPVLILAGAGSGKTRVLACRAAHLIHSGITRPYRILALTFTNRSAHELRTRVIEMAGEEGQQIVAGTFHSIFARLIRQQGLNIGINPNFTIVDSGDKRKLIKTIMDEIGYTPQDAKPAQIDWIISNAKNSMVNPNQFEETARFPIERIVANVYRVYEDRLNRMDGLDFDDLLGRPLKAFTQYPSFLEYLQNRFHYVMVDEYQDTNRVQYMLIREIAKAHGNLCVVGDDDQAIYGFRGASVENILDFEKDWKDAKKIHLEQNYRSTKQILDVAWSVIHNNSKRHPKKLWTEKSEGQLVELIRTFTDDEEARRFVSIIDEERQTHKRQYSQFAVLYRVNAQSLVLEQVFRAAQIPYKILGGLRFYERKEVKDVLAYLRLLVNPSDDISLMRIINYPPRGISVEFVKELHSQAIADSVSIFDRTTDAIQDDLFSSRRITALTKFTEMMNGFRERSTEIDFSDLAQEIVNQVGIRERLEFEEKDDRTRAESKLANLNSLLGDIARYTVEKQANGSNGNGSTLEVIATFLEEVSLVTDNDDVDDNNKVNLLTMHSAKGLEFPVVFISGMEEGVIPMRPPDGSIPDFEEERRLFYVGATRAMERLVLGSTTGTRFRWGERRWEGESRFLAEIPPEMLKGGVELVNASLYTKTKQQTVQHSTKPKAQPNGNSNLDELYSGVLVRHHKFGLGIIIKIEKRGIESKLDVDFDDFGKKTLIFKYAKLEVER